ncbi:heat shock protein Hsp15 [Terriglobus roseus]|uniref:Heat shock protein Hsp15 n=2 Tax=Terriglobus roseus TaxID=392734 RepID=A0A1G7FGT4_9BACT|nr:RNA-binding S4 domain-containing protein [Terriglobus roseus]SDE75126.1 heat shock protein Hsp15 [Terriglobus roseus]
MDSVRLDKWLWAARFFKTRALAVKACELGRIKLRDQPVKPAREIKAGDVLRITNDGGIFTVDVLALSDVRGPAAAAQALYCETEESVAARKKEQEARKMNPWFEMDRSERPTKRDRRDLNRLRGR